MSGRAKEGLRSGLEACAKNEANCSPASRETLFLSNMAKTELFPPLFALDFLKIRSHGRGRGSWRRCWRGVSNREACNRSCSAIAWPRQTRKHGEPDKYTRPSPAVPRECRGNNLTAIIGDKTWKQILKSYSKRITRSITVAWVLRTINYLRRA